MGPDVGFRWQRLQSSYYKDVQIIFKNVFSMTIQIWNHNKETGKKKEPNRNIRLKKYNNWSEKFITWAQQQVGEDRESSQ